MTLLPHDTLPLATTAAFTPRSIAPQQDASAWTRALARATATAPVRAAWQADAPAGSADAAPPAVLVGRSFPEHGQAALAATGLASAPRPQSAGMPARVVAAGALPARAGAATVFEPAPPPASAPGEPPCPECAEEAPRSPRPRAPVQEAAGPRVHVELHDEGLAVWLGVDASPPMAAERAAGVLEALRRDGAAWPRLALLVCNGIPVHTHSHPSKETP